MCQVCLFTWTLFSQLPLSGLWTGYYVVHVQEWDIVIHQVLVTCSEAVNDWEISGIIRPITAGITQSSNLRRQTSKLRDIDNLSGKQPICPTSIKMTGSMRWLEHGETHHFLHQNMKSPFFRRDKNEGSADLWWINHWFRDLLFGMKNINISEITPNTSGMPPGPGADSWQGTRGISR